MTTPRIEEMVEEKLEKMFEVKNGFFSSGDYTTKRFAVWEICQALTEAHQAGIDKAVDAVKIVLNREINILSRFRGDGYHDYAREYLEDIRKEVKALQDNK